MTTNLNFFERWLRLFLGCFLLAWAIAGGPAWAFSGLYLIASGAARVCIFYSLFDTPSRPSSH